MAEQSESVVRIGGERYPLAVLDDVTWREMLAAERHLDVTWFEVLTSVNRGGAAAMLASAFVGTMREQPERDLGELAATLLAAPMAIDDDPAAEAADDDPPAKPRAARAKPAATRGSGGPRS